GTFALRRMTSPRADAHAPAREEAGLSTRYLVSPSLTVGFDRTLDTLTTTHWKRTRGLGHVGRSGNNHLCKVVHERKRSAKHRIRLAPPYQPRGTHGAL